MRRLDFSGVRVHSDPLAQQATAAMGARAFAYGGDVFLGPGESGGDVGLMAGTYDTAGTDIHFDNFVVRQP